GWSVLVLTFCCLFFFFFSSRRRHTRFSRDWSSDVCSSDLSLAQIETQYSSVVCPSPMAPMSTAKNSRVCSGMAALAPKPTSSNRSEERRVGKECRSRWSAYHEKKKIQIQGGMKRVSVKRML